MIQFFVLALCVLCQARGIFAENFLKKAEWNKAVQTPEDHKRLAFFQSLYDKSQSDRKPVGEIPKVLHVIVLGSTALPSQSNAIFRKWLEKHPGWHMKLWTDRNCSAPIEGVQVMAADQFPLEKCADCYYSAESFDERSLLLRYAILFSEGGVYIDHDAECIASIEPIRAAHDFFCGLEQPGPSMRSSSINPSCHLIGAAAAHPILAEAQQLQLAHWQSFEKLLPGTDSLSIVNRIVHRSVQALSIAIEKAASLDGRKDAVFPPHYFSSTAKDAAQYVLAPAKSLFGRRIEQAQTKEKIEDAFSGIHKQLKICLYLIVALAALNLFLGAVIFHLYRKRKEK